ncbi:hypothetical protein LTV02_12230 [Nocardia yamanashiensis]|uniref:hypothetical protein n=1 Tax=Nocardia yamanashiensis TaxID=209247 RepID=UPI001E50B56B|nr:hypothetical protein [Nocardia yamanashiensis]UGT44101.1 hypothetical protein LTV02_12230 [Nocardia yamanashiensis]
MDLGGGYRERGNRSRVNANPALTLTPAMTTVPIDRVIAEIPRVRTRLIDNASTTVPQSIPMMCIGLSLLAVISGEYPFCRYQTVILDLGHIGLRITAEAYQTGIVHRH